eukprot:TRINITY_DN2162_c2_g4_i4.p1 TRINITY_DN2162_c2_g4~~TRINITY_DN2162_c2_g4_i4.p1  ORF type:complete len:1410 (+),score=-131.56 TRINITY_DN2162_c2_g4_i4:89-4231(+)
MVSVSRPTVALSLALVASAATVQAGAVVHRDNFMSPWDENISSPSSPSISSSSPSLSLFLSHSSFSPSCRHAFPFSPPLLLSFPTVPLSLPSFDFLKGHDFGIGYDSSAEDHRFFQGNKEKRLPISVMGRVLFVALFLVSLSRVSRRNGNSVASKYGNNITAIDLFGRLNSVTAADGGSVRPFHLKRNGWRLLRMLLVASLFLSGAGFLNCDGFGSPSPSAGSFTPGPSNYDTISAMDFLCLSSDEMKEKNESGSSRTGKGKGKRNRIDEYNRRIATVERFCWSLLGNRFVRFLLRLVLSVVVGSVAEALNVGNALFFYQLTVQWVRMGKGRKGSKGMNWSQRVVIVVGLWLCFGFCGAICTNFKFQYLVARNYFGFPSTGLVVDLSDDIVTFVGPSGFGKTTLMRSLFHLCASFAGVRSSPRINSPAADGGIVSDDNATMISWACAIIPLREDFGVLGIRSSRHRANKDRKWDPYFFICPNAIVKSTIAKDATTKLEEMVRDAKAPEPDHWSIGVARSVRYVPQDHKLCDGELLAVHEDNLSEYLKKILPESADNLSESMSRICNKKIKFKSGEELVEVDESKINLTKLSGGQLDCLLSLLPLFDEECKIVLFDEAGQNLHAPARRLLRSFITQQVELKSVSQVFLVTHHTEMLDIKSLPRGIRRVFLSKVHSSVTRKQRLIDIHSFNPPPSSLAMWQNFRFVELYFARSVILVEGRTDVQVLSALRDRIVKLQSLRKNDTFLDSALNDCGIDPDFRDRGHYMIEAEGDDNVLLVSSFLDALEVPHFRVRDTDTLFSELPQRKKRYPSVKEKDSMAYALSHKEDKPWTFLQVALVPDSNAVITQTISPIAKALSQLRLQLEKFQDPVREELARELNAIIYNSFLDTQERIVSRNLEYIADVCFAIASQSDRASSSSKRSSWWKIGRRSLEHAIAAKLLDRGFSVDDCILVMSCLRKCLSSIRKHVLQDQEDVQIQFRNWKDLQERLQRVFDESDCVDAEYAIDKLRSTHADITVIDIPCEIILNCGRDLERGPGSDAHDSIWLRFLSEVVFSSGINERCAKVSTVDFLWPLAVADIEGLLFDKGVQNPRLRDTTADPHGISSNALLSWLKTGRRFSVALEIENTKKHVADSTFEDICARFELLFPDDGRSGCWGNRYCSQRLGLSSFVKELQSWERSLSSRTCGVLRWGSQSRAFYDENTVFISLNHKEKGVFPTLNANRSKKGRTALNRDFIFNTSLVDSIRQIMHVPAEGQDTSRTSAIWSEFFSSILDRIQSGFDVTCSPSVTISDDIVIVFYFISWTRFRVDHDIAECYNYASKRMSFATVATKDDLNDLEVVWDGGCRRFSSKTKEIIDEIIARIKEPSEHHDEGEVQDFSLSS